MPNSALFKPIHIRELKLDNRIVIAPMCQYSAVDGCMTDWHSIHLGNLALSGAGLLTIEATAVVPEGRITYADVGLYDDATELAMARTLDTVRRWSKIPIAIQLAHAGRKASTDVPWSGGGQFPAEHLNGWQTEGPSSIALREGYAAPSYLDRDGLVRIRNAFVKAAQRAAYLGIDAVQLHGAHGYLLHQFMSPLSNIRTDEYGGSLQNRLRFPLEVFDAVREAVPDTVVTMRISGSDWVDGGFDISQSIELAKELEKRGCDAIHVTSGGLHPSQQITDGPNYQVPFARAIKSAVKVPVVAVGLITDAVQAEAIVGTGDADLIAVARTILYDPRWPWHAAAALGGQVNAPDQYLRCQPAAYGDLFRSR